MYVYVCVYGCVHFSVVQNSGVHESADWCCQRASSVGMQTKTTKFTPYEKT